MADGGSVGGIRTVQEFGVCLGFFFNINFLKTLKKDSIKRIFSLAQVICLKVLG